MHRLIRIAIPLVLALATPLAHAFGTLTSTDGKPQTLDNYLVKGKWNVVMVWASYCGTCNEEVGKYMTFYNKHKDRDATVIGISVDGKDNKADADAFLKRHKVNFPNAIAELESVEATMPKMTGKEWLGTPTFLIYKPNGELASMKVGAVPTSFVEDLIARESTKR